MNTTDRDRAQRVERVFTCALDDLLDAIEDDRGEEVRADLAQVVLALAAALPKFSRRSG